MVDFVLEHPSISRVHFALVHHQHGGTYIIDLGSGLGLVCFSTKLWVKLLLSFCLILAVLC